jgi:hypothetical protein
MSFNNKSRQINIAHAGRAAFNVKNMLAATAVKVMVVMIAASLVVSGLPGNFHHADQLRGE